MKDVRVVFTLRLPSDTNAFMVSLTCGHLTMFSVLQLLAY